MESANKLLTLLRFRFRLLSPSMLRIVNIVTYLPRLLLGLVLIYPLRWIIAAVKNNLQTKTVDKQLWRNLKDASSYAEWERAAEALNRSDRDLMKWKIDPKGNYSYDSIQERTVQLDSMDPLWRSKESRNFAAYYELLMPIQVRDIGHITRPALHGHLWTGTKDAIERYVAAAVRGVRTLRRTDVTGARLDEKNEWFKARRMVLGRTALFLQGGSVFGLGHLGVMKALFENKLLPEVIIGTQAGALIAALICIRTDEELKELFTGYGSSINLDAFTSRTAQHAGTKKVGWKVLVARLHRWLSTGKALDPATLEQCIIDNLGDITFERAWQLTGRSLCITLASDAPGTPNMLSWKTAPNVLVRTAALASSEMHPDKCLDMILEKNSRGEIRPWILNDETPAYRDLRRRKRWPSQKPPVWRVQELWHVNHYIISASRPYILPFNPGTHYWAIHKPTTPFYHSLRLLDYFSLFPSLAVIFTVLLGRSIFRRRPDPIPVGLNSAREEQTITPQRRARPVQIVPSTSWRDLLAFARNPTHEEVAAWMVKGERATWPVVRALEVRMGVEKELHKKYKGDPEDKPRRTLADLAQRLRREREQDTG